MFLFFKMHLAMFIWPINCSGSDFELEFESTSVSQDSIIVRLWIKVSLIFCLLSLGLLLTASALGLVDCPPPVL